MGTKEIREELESLGIGTRLLIEKSELIDTLANDARDLAASKTAAEFPGVNALTSRTEVRGNIKDDTDVTTDSYANAASSLCVC